MLFRTGFVGRQVVGSSGSSTAPSLSLDFTRPGVLDPRVVFTRASSGTYFDSNGVMQTAGLNLSTNSQALGSWPTKSDTTITDNNTVSPDGTTNASSLTTGSAGNDSTSNTAATVAAGSTLTFSCFAKRGNFDWLHLFGSDAGTANGVQTWVNLATGAVSNTAVLGTATAPNVVVTTLGNGWYRIAATVTMPGTSTTAFLMFRTAASAGSGTRFLNGQYYVWGCQVELGPVATQYAPTTTVANSGPRWDYDPVSLQLRGLLLEDQRTNGVRNSTMQGAVPGSPGTLPTNWLLGGSAAVTPQVVGTGTENGVPYIDLRLVGTTTSVLLALLPETTTAIAAANGQAWTSSVYLRLVAGSLSNINSVQLSTNETTAAGASVRTNFGPLWTVTTVSLAAQRFVYSVTLTGGGTVGAVHQRINFNVPSGVAIDATFRIGAPQMEQGDFPTSYIPTTGAAVVRSIDSCLIPPANMSPWFAPPGGSWFAEFDYLDSTPANSRVIARPNVGGSTTPFAVNAAQAIFQYDGVGLATANSGTANTTVRSASTWTTGQAKICLNGGAVASAANLVSGYGLFATFGVGFMSCSVALATDNTSGHIRRVQYYPRVLADAEMQTLTTITDPSLFLNFMNPNTLDPRIAFTRASTATYTDVNGVVQTANNDTPRWDYDPVTHALRGLLLEEARTNLILQSTDFGNAAWPKTSAVVAVPIVTTDQTFAPDGTMSGDQIVYPASGGGGSMAQVSQGYTGTASAYTLSVWLKGSVGGEQVYIWTQTGVANYTRLRCVLTTAWQRFSITATLTATGWGFGIGVDLRDAQQSATPAQTIYAWGAQVELGAFPTSFIQTTGSTVTRAADIMTLPTAGWVNQTAGTLQSEITLQDAPSTPGLIHEWLSMGVDPSNCFRISQPNTAGSTLANVFTGGTGRGGPGDTSAHVANVPFRNAATYDTVALRVSVSTSGAPPTVATVNFYPTMTTLDIGGTAPPGRGGAMAGWMRVVQYWPRVLPDAGLQQVTT